MPWKYGDDAVKTTAKMVKAKLRLMPYIFGQVSALLLLCDERRTSLNLQAIKATETGLPVMRSMVIEFPEDPTCALLDKQ